MIKRFSIQLIIRVLLLLASSFALTWVIQQAYWFSVAAVLSLMVWQVYALNRYVNETNYSLSKFLEALKGEDYSVYFSPSAKGSSFAELYRDFNAIIGIYKKNKTEKEAQHKHFQQILEQIQLGVISIQLEDLEETQSPNEILFFNRAAGEILGQPRHKYWHRLERQLPWLGKEIRDLSAGGRRLVEWNVGGDRKQLSLDIVYAKFLGQANLIISFQDINMEIEQKEIEAWHNIIRVLAHEMLNSFTPVRSLASTIKLLTEDEQGALQTEIDHESLNDINLAASTIHKRSAGLMEFVNDYRAISQVPVPRIQSINVRDFLENIYRLMKPELDSHQIEWIPAQVPPRSLLSIDGKLIEQVLINLIGNSIHALEGRDAPYIRLHFELRSDQAVISVEDNGKGVPKEIMRQIFVPFFTTRKNGSGIGLSLSKSIMRQHKGQLIVHSEEGKFTMMSLVFPEVT
ncbi:MAG: ATP-binding protein [Bacteroidota bacterium]